MENKIPLSSNLIGIIIKSFVFFEQAAWLWSHSDNSRHPYRVQINDHKETFIDRYIESINAKTCRLVSYSKLNNETYWGKWTDPIESRSIQILELAEIYDEVACYFKDTLTQELFVKMESGDWNRSDFCELLEKLAESSMDSDFVDAFWTQVKQHLFEKPFWISDFQYLSKLIIEHSSRFAPRDTDRFISLVEETSSDLIYETVSLNSHQDSTQLVEDVDVLNSIADFYDAELTGPIEALNDRIAEIEADNDNEYTDTPHSPEPSAQKVLTDIELDSMFLTLVERGLSPEEKLIQSIFGEDEEG